jgi:dihydroorotase
MEIIEYNDKQMDGIKSLLCELQEFLISLDKSGCHFHVCHASCKETVDLVRKAKKEGVNVTCETAPHYLLLSEMDMKEYGCYRFQPPLRKLRDRLALLQGVQDGTIDMIATDHAPHSLEEKSKGLSKSANGIVGLECAFQVLYTNLVLQGVISLEKLLSLMIDNPSKIFGIGSKIEIGNPAEFSVWDLNSVTKINSSTFESKGRSTPFDGQVVYGKRRITMMRGKKYED